MTRNSGVPLAKKLGIKKGHKIYVKNLSFDSYIELIDEFPEGVENEHGSGLDIFHLFTKSIKELENEAKNFRTKIKPTGMIWVSWPKKSSKINTDVTEDYIRKVTLPLGFVDVKVCAINEIWSGLKLVLRKENRNGSSQNLRA